MSAAQDDGTELDSDDILSALDDDADESDAPEPETAADDDDGTADDAGAPPSDQAAPPGQDPAAKGVTDGSAPTSGAKPDAGASIARPATATDWGFRVDGTDVPVPGAWRDGEHIVIPAEAWDRHIQRQYVANRESWRREREGYVRRISTAEDARTARERTADQISERMNEVLASPDAFLAFAQDFERNRDLLLAQAQTDALQQQISERETAEQQEQAQRRLETEVVPGMQNRLANQLEQMLGHPSFAPLATTMDEKVQLLQELWNEGAALWTEHVQADTVRGIPAGFIELNVDALEQAMQRRARWVQRAGVKAEHSNGAAARNAAAVAPSQVKTQAPMVRRSDGTFKGKGQAQAAKASEAALTGAARRRAVRQELRATNWLDDDDD